MSLPFGLNTVTGGLSNTPGQTFTPAFISDGLPADALPLPQTQPNALEKTNFLSSLPTLTSITDLPQSNTGDLVVSTPTGFSVLGKDLTSSTSLSGEVRPALISNLVGDLDGKLFSTGMVYTGSDIRILIEPTEIPTGSAGMTYKQLIEATTMTVSVYRSKARASALGYINPKGFARGRRTIAGTLILTQFTTEVLMEFLAGMNVQNTSKDSQYSKVDQLPPFNMTMFFSNESGYASYRRILGVEFVSDGVVYSQNDMMSEQTLSYMAADFTPLLPLDLTSLWATGQSSSRASQPEKTVGDLWTGPDTFQPTNTFSV